VCPLAQPNSPVRRLHIPYTEPNVTAKPVRGVAWVCAAQLQLSICVARCSSASVRGELCLRLQLPGEPCHARLHFENMLLARARLQWPTSGKRQPATKSMYRYPRQMCGESCAIICSWEGL
jgi:hypothetical protein